MAHRRVFNSPQISGNEPDQHWIHMHTEDPHLYLEARSGAAENGPVFPAGDNIPVDQAHYIAQWNLAAGMNGPSSSSQTVNIQHNLQAEASEPSHDPLHPSVAGDVLMVPENHVPFQPTSNYGLESNYFDLGMGNGRGPYKRKSPGIPIIGERGSTSRYYCAGSSSNVSSSSEMRPEKPNPDGQYGHWDSMTVTSAHRPEQLSLGGESSLRSVRSRSASDLETDAFRSHTSASYSQHFSSNRHPIDHSVDHPSQNRGVTLQEWIHFHVSGGARERTIVPNNSGHEMNHFFPGSSVNGVATEMGGLHHNPHSGRDHTVPQSTHTRGVRSSFSHRSNPTTRVPLANMRFGHVGSVDETLQVMAESHSSRYPRPFTSGGWRHDRHGRLRLSSERLRSLTEDVAGHDRLTPEGFMIAERLSYYGSRNPFDQHGDMRLDVDNMSYEELLALGERIGSVNTGLSEDQLSRCLTEAVYCSSDQTREEGRCVICLEEYQQADDVAAVKYCGHRYHVGCIKKWLSMKNLCPICKGPALPDNMKDK